MLILCEYRLTALLPVKLDPASGVTPRAPRGAITIEGRPLPAAARTIDAPGCIEVRRAGMLSVHFDQGERAAP